MWFCTGLKVRNSRLIALWYCTTALHCCMLGFNKFVQNQESWMDAWKLLWVPQRMPVLTQRTGSLNVYHLGRTTKTTFSLHGKAREERDECICFTLTKARARTSDSLSSLGDSWQRERQTSKRRLKRLLFWSSECVHVGLVGMASCHALSELMVRRHSYS